MKTKIATVAALAVTLTACACHKVAPVESKAPRPAAVRRTVAISSVHMDRTAGRQVASLMWNRDGVWTPVKVVGQYSQISQALIARDKMGDRLLVASPSAGYQIARIHIDCARDAFSIDGARRVASDGAPAGPGKDDRSLMPIVRHGEIARICTAGQSGGVTYKGAPFKIAPQLRDAGIAAAARVEPTAEQRAALWKKYQADHPAGTRAPNGK